MKAPLFCTVKINGHQVCQATKMTTTKKKSVWLVNYIQSLLMLHEQKDYSLKMQIQIWSQEPLMLNLASHGILCFVILLFVNYDNNSWKSSDENLFLCELFHAIYIYRYLNVQKYSGSSEGWHFLFKYTGIITLMHLKNTCPASC